MFSKKATIIDKIFPVDLKLCSKCQIDGEDFVDLCGLLRKQKLYWAKWSWDLLFSSIYEFSRLSKSPSFDSVQWLNMTSVEWKYQLEIP